uniref:Uncharacterized protein n=1 Tax=Salix viminalis TaxID=40686 RepID=A0A6N2KJF5_SALVM
MDHGSPEQVLTATTHCISAMQSVLMFFRGFNHGGRTYTFPMTGAAFSTIRYSNELANISKSMATQVLACCHTLPFLTDRVGLYRQQCMNSHFGTSSLMTLPSLSAQETRQHRHRNWFHIRRGSSDEKETGHYLKFKFPYDYDGDEDDEERNKLTVYEARNDTNLKRKGVPKTACGD